MTTRASSPNFNSGGNTIVTNQFAPTLMDQAVYASKNDVYVYSSPNSNSKITGFRNKVGNYKYKVNEEIGTYQDESQVSGGETYYKIEWEFKYRTVTIWQALFPPSALLSIPLKTEYRIAWVKGSEISGYTQEQQDNITKLTKDAKFQDDLDKILEPDGTPKGDANTAPKGLFARIFGPTLSNDNAGSNKSTIVLVVSLLALTIGGAIWALIKRNKSKKQ